ncbi:hypothetical protein BH10BAC4_BH10BAC4_16890 [soil metagenome]
MKTTLNIPQELLTSIDMMNTLNGGTSEPLVRLQKFPAQHQITLRVPGIGPENIKIEINNNQLMIYYLIPMVSQMKPINFPRIVDNKDIPYCVDVHNIVADEEDNALVVTLPFNELANGYHRDISLPRE